MRKVESRRQGPPAKKRETGRGIDGALYNLVTECMKRTKALILSGDFHFRMSIFIFVSFSAVNGISFFVGIFVYGRKLEIVCGRPLVYITKGLLILVLVLRCKVLVWVLNTRLGLGLGLERKS